MKTDAPTDPRATDVQELREFITAVGKGEIPTKGWLVIVDQCLTRLEKEKYDQQN